MRTRATLHGPRSLECVNPKAKDRRVKVRLAIGSFENLPIPPG